MKQTINQSQFMDAFERMGRKDQFSYDGKKALFEYLEQYEDEAGEEVELDVIALCVGFTEYKNLAELKANYTSIEDLEDLENRTQVIYIDDREEVEEGKGRFIIQDF